MENNIELKILKMERQFVFNIINRGKLWYDSLTETELAELQTWYQAWLDVTDTLVRPTRPTWLK